MGQPLYCSAPGPWGERGYGDGSTNYAWLRSITLLPWLPGFPPQVFLTTVSLTSSLSLHSQQHPSPWDCSTVPMLQLPTIACSRGPASLPGVRMAAARSVCFSFNLGCHRSAVSLSALNISFSDSENCPIVGIRPLPQFPHLPRAGPVLLTPVFPLVPSSYGVLHGFMHYFLLVRYFWLLSAGVLHALLCWRHIPDVSVERCNPPTPSPSCSAPWL